MTNQGRRVKSTTALVLASFAWMLANTIFNLRNQFVILLLKKNLYFGTKEFMLEVYLIWGTLFAYVTLQVALKQTKKNYIAKGVQDF